MIETADCISNFHKAPIVPTERKSFSPTFSTYQSSLRDVSLVEKQLNIMLSFRRNDWLNRKLCENLKRLQQPNCCFRKKCVLCSKIKHCICNNRTIPCTVKH